MKVFNDFVTNTSLHGWSFFGSPTGSTFQKIFWFAVLSGSFFAAGYFIILNVNIFLSTYIIINIEDRTSDLDNIHFPSVAICNINPLRKSFIYWIHENLNDAGRTDASVGDIFDAIGSQYFSSNVNIDQLKNDKNQKLLDDILDSDFFEIEFRKFLDEKVNKSSFPISGKKNTVFSYNQQEDVVEEAFGEYNQSTKKLYHKTFLQELASQWKEGQMIPYIQWSGMDPDDPQNGTGGVFLEIGYATSFGICNFITPYFRHMPPDTDQMTLKYLKKGALSGENNGLSVLLDAETFDYGNGFATIGEREGVGFKASVVHHLDLPVMESTAMQVNVGSSTHLAVTSTKINITEDATVFQPMDRRCWLQGEINLTHFSYEEDYR